ncbi:MAG TPA: glycerate kinase [Acidimicrobiales bacterium]|nr:glycerate kinase [Acidimicrobiales bacterium]
MPHLLAAPDKFRGTVTAAEAAEAACAGARGSGWTAEALPLADGGEGTLDVLGGANRTTPVHGPLGEVVEAGWRLDGDRAVIEMARASGLGLVGGPRGNDALAATTAGTGELIAAAVGAGARSVVVAVGGSATTDGGLGCLEVLSRARLSGVDLVVACDVDISFVEAAEAFAPQKGAGPRQVDMLRRRLERLVVDYRHRYGVDVTSIEGGGAAGGLAGGLAALGARLVPGFEVVAEAVGLEARVAGADLVLTGEGFVDEQSFRGKVVGGVIETCRQSGKAAVVVAGEVFVEPGVASISLVEAFGRQRALEDTPACITEAVADHLRAL